jgi:hypothetical protein
MTAKPGDTMRSVTRLLPLLLLVLMGHPFAAAAAEPWRDVYRWLEGRRDQMAEELEQAHTTLLARARAQRDELLIAKLRGAPPSPRRHGYGVLPEIVDSPLRGPVHPRRRSYSLESLSTAYAPAFRDAALLARRSTAGPDLPLAPWVDEFQRLRERMGNLEDHLDYHARWQVAIVEHRAWFTRRNRIAERTRGMVEAIERGAPDEEVEALRREVLLKLAPFRPASGLAIERAGDALVLPVEVATDIDDETFLAVAARAVAEEFSQSDAARVARLSLEVRWRRVAVDVLYPEGPPDQASAIDPDDHLRRFPDGALILTTGAASTYARPRRAVLLGPSPLARRTLAHEFGHLLGFDDAYLRCYEGDPAGPYGAVLVEWTGLSDDLMGNPRGGRVTAEMVETLIEAYGVSPEAAAPLE